MKRVKGVLLLYHRPWIQDAITVKEHIESFSKYSQFDVVSVNTYNGFPKELANFRFDIIVLHYSLFGANYLINGRFQQYLQNSHESYKIAFFQDEHHYCQQRFKFINEFKINCVYSLLESRYYRDTYCKYCKSVEVKHTLTGYVSEGLLLKAARYSKPDAERSIDIGYRGRQLAYYMGKGSQEKYEIAKRFLIYSNGTNLTLDIDTQENTRMYGDKWYKFLGNQKACLGVEAGVSIFDIEDKVRLGSIYLLHYNPSMTFPELADKLLNKWEGNIYYRTISPRHFEASAFRICQILYEGKYQGILKPMIHYIPLKKSFSNFDDVVLMFRDEVLRHILTWNCYRDLILSGEYSYKRFISEFDENLVKNGFIPIKQDNMPKKFGQDNILRGRLHEYAIGFLATRLGKLVLPLVRFIYRYLMKRLNIEERLYWHD